MRELFPRAPTEQPAHRHDSPPLKRPTAGPAILGLQHQAGNRAVTGLFVQGSGGPTLQRLALQDGPPLAPGHYRYGSAILGLAPAAMRTFLAGMAGTDGLEAERKWQQGFVADMRATTTGGHSYEDPELKQSVKVEPTLATNAERAQADVESQAAAAQAQFQQQLLGSVRGMLASSEQKIEGEARRYGFPDHDSIFNPKPLTAGQAALGPSMPGGDDVRGAIRAAKELLDGKRKVRKARESVAKLGPLLGDAARPNTLEPVLSEYHSLRQKHFTKFPILAALERNEERLAEMASGAQFAGPGSTGPAASAALAKAKEEMRKEIADKLSNIAYVRSRMDEPDKVDKFWLDPALRESTKRGLAIAPPTLPHAAIEDKVRRLTADAEFEAKLKAVMGTGLLVLSFVPGVGAVAGAAGLLMGAVDVIGAFQEYYWEEAAAGTSLEKAEAISQTEPSLFGLALSIATGLLEGVAEAKALEGAIGVFKAVRSAYREARAAAVVANAGSGAAKAAGAADLVAASEKLRTTADQAAGKPGLGDRILADLPADARSAARSLDQSLKVIKDPALKELVRRGDRAVTSDGETLMDLAINDPHGLAEDFAEWQRGESGKRFEDWLRDVKQMHPHGILTDPAGVVEWGLDAAGARRSYEACLREDPAREAGIYRDPATGEHVCVQGSASFVATSWMADADNLRGGVRPRWEMVIHHHPNRGLAIDRLPSMEDFAHITHEQRAVGTQHPVRSLITWTDPVSGIRFETEFGYTPGAPRPYWARYRVDDGTFRTASFQGPPFGSGSAEYQQFLDSFTARPTHPVPGGNLPPVTAPPRR
ncbi:MAG TPA: hypothetical protein VGX25_21765 [Actinophytocola sp.]|uniref:hypothetical protein n=1 Tax=Actinophytocola sp. TaxID=1872138 RepID=UPI002DDCBF9B|nr:hypothetical protein [Actinophytocola sp.]HEV2782026.1 hypothetical protein [Actinophytocola sp.]